jgi:hypothetical protein
VAPETGDTGNREVKYTVGAMVRYFENSDVSPGEKKKILGQDRL